MLKASLWHFLRTLNSIATETSTKHDGRKIKTRLDNNHVVKNTHVSTKYRCFGRSQKTTQARTIIIPVQIYHGDRRHREDRDCKLVAIATLYTLPLL